MLGAARAFTSVRVTLDVFGSLGRTGALACIWVTLDGSDNFGSSWARWGARAFTSVNIMLGAAGTFTSVRVTLDVFGSLGSTGALASIRVTLNGSDSFGSSWAVRVLGAMSSVLILLWALRSIDIVLRG